MTSKTTVMNPDSYYSRCFACDRKLGKTPREVDTRDDQTVFVGTECFRLITAAGDSGYQPPKGGPRLYLLSKCETCDGRGWYLERISDDHKTQCIKCGGTGMHEGTRTK